MEWLRNFTLTLSRFCLSIFFLTSSVKNILYWQAAESELTSIFLDWQGYVDFSQEVLLVFALFIGWIPVILSVFTALMFVGGLLVLIGVKEKLGISLLLLYLLPVAILYHPFWWIEDVTREAQTFLFLKDLALAGCLMQLLCFTSAASSQISADPFSDSFAP